MNDTSERRPPHPDAPHAVPEDPPLSELLGYLGLPSYPPDRAAYHAGDHQARRADAAAVEAAANAARGEPDGLGEQPL